MHCPDNTFDGIFSSGSIEHFGSWSSIADSAFEMGRVLKPGSVMTVSTEYCIGAPPGGEGWDGLRFFSRERLLRYIVEASGLEPDYPSSDNGWAKPSAQLAAEIEQMEANLKLGESDNLVNRGVEAPLRRVRTRVRRVFDR